MKKRFSTFFILVTFYKCFNVVLFIELFLLKRHQYKCNSEYNVYVFHVLNIFICFYICGSDVPLSYRFDFGSVTTLFVCCLIGK